MINMNNMNNMPPIQPISSYNSQNRNQILQKINTSNFEYNKAPLYNSRNININETQ